MTDRLTAALQEMAESEPPHGLDAARIMREGRRGETRRRLAALGGGTAVLVATGLAVGVLAPAGSAGRPSTDGPGGHAVAQTPAAPVDPHDPIVTHWQFGYLPDGMTVQGGAGSPTGKDSSVWAYDGSGFRLLISPLAGAPDFRPKTTGTKSASPFAGALEGMAL